MPTICINSFLERKKPTEKSGEASQKRQKCSKVAKKVSKMPPNKVAYVHKKYTKNIVFINEEKLVKNMGGHQGNFFQYKKILFLNYPPPCT